MTELTTIILAAGDGIRMRSSIPKLMHPIAGMPIVGHVVKAAIEAGSSQIAAVTSPDHDAIRQLILSLAPDASVFEQKQRLGTGHAAQMARPVWENAQGYVAVVYGDHPLLKAQTFNAIFARLDEGWDAAILGFEPDDTTGYGRFIIDGENLLGIVEHKDASDDQLKIKQCNACVLAFKADVFRKTIDQLKNNNAQSEYYLTDLVGLANDAGLKVTYAIEPAQDVMGVNSRIQLAEAETLFQQRLRSAAMENGATLRDPHTTYFSYDTKLGQDVTIEPGVVFGTGVVVADNVTIKAYSHIEGTMIGQSAVVGPFARLRSGTELAENTKVGNFCETKNAQIAKGVKVSHLSYIGDANIGENANIGAGTITCNYDGFNKHHTEIGAGAFIGSNTALVAPVNVGENAIVAAGSTIVRDVAKDDLALSRADQHNRRGYAPKLRARAKRAKAKKTN